MKNLNLISLSQGIPHLNSDSQIREFVIAAIKTNRVDKYSEDQGVKVIRDLISNKLSEDGMNYSSDEIILTTGAIEAVHSVFLSLQSPNTEILIPTPTYYKYFILAKYANIKLVPFPLNEKQGWDLDIDLFKQKITKHTKAILICNPNNPTGSIYSKEKILQICEEAKKLGIKVILDDIYTSFCFEGEIFNPCKNPRYKETVIRIVSLSKTFALTGWRIGYLHSDLKTIRKILPIHKTIAICAPVVSQYAAMATFLFSDHILKQIKPIYGNNRKIMGDYLMKIPQLQAFWPKGAYYFFPRVKGLTNSLRFCNELMQKQQLAVSPGSEFGPGGEGCIRLCFGKSENEIHEGMKRLQNFLKSF